MKFFLSLTALNHTGEPVKYKNALFLKMSVAQKECLKNEIYERSVYINLLNSDSISIHSYPSLLRTPLECLSRFYFAIYCGCPTEGFLWIPWESYWNCLHHILVLNATQLNWVLEKELSATKPDKYTYHLLHQLYTCICLDYHIQHPDPHNNYRQLSPNQLWKLPKLKKTPIIHGLRFLECNFQSFYFYQAQYSITFSFLSVVN